jgi:hypothetical protein
VNELVGVAFQRRPAVVLALAGAAVHTAPVVPGMGNALETDVALLVAKAFGNRIFAVGAFGTVQAAPGEEGGDFGDGESE